MIQIRIQLIHIRQKDNLILKKNCLIVNEETRNLNIN